MLSLDILKTVRAMSNSTYVIELPLESPCCHEHPFQISLTLFITYDNAILGNNLCLKYYTLKPTIANTVKLSDDSPVCTNTYHLICSCQKRINRIYIIP